MGGRETGDGRRCVACTIFDLSICFCRLLFGIVATALFLFFGFYRVVSGACFWDDYVTLGHVIGLLLSSRLGHMGWMV